MPPGVLADKLQVMLKVPGAATGAAHPRAVPAAVKSQQMGEFLGCSHSQSWFWGDDRFPSGVKDVGT